MSRATDEIRRLVGPLDPMRADTRVATPPPLDLPAAGPERSERPQRHPVRRRSVLAAVASVAVVAGAVVAWNATGPTAPKGYAATPPPLVIVPSSDGRPGKAVLEEIAVRAATSGVPAGTPGGTEYRKTQEWYLNSQIDSSGTISAVEATEREEWRHPDGSGRSVTRTAPPEFQSDADREKWVSDQSGGTDVQDYEPGELRRHWENRPPTSSEEMRKWLWRPNPPDDIGPVKTVRAITDLLRERVLGPEERAAVLSVIAGLPGLNHDGETRDRIGRPGQAFSLESIPPGLPTRHTFIVDPTNGIILGSEEMLTTSAGKLNVRIPAVLSYEAYVRDEFWGAS